MNSTPTNREIDAAIQAEMTVSYTRSDAHGGIDVAAVRDAVPRGVSSQDDESGSGTSPNNLAELLESCA